MKLMGVNVGLASPGALAPGHTRDAALSRTGLKSSAQRPKYPSGTELVGDRQAVRGPQGLSRVSRVLHLPAVGTKLHFLSTSSRPAACSIYHDLSSALLARIIIGPIFNRANA